MSQDLSVSADETHPAPPPDDDAATPGRGRRPRLSYLLYLVGLLTLAAILAEWVIAPRSLGLPRSAALIGFVAEPDIVFGRTPTNRLGLTGDVCDGRKPSGGVRVLTLGGSVIFNRDFTRRLKAALESAAGQPVEVLGAGLPSHTSAASVVKMRYLANRDFDYVLIYHGINDLFANNVPREVFRDDYSHLSSWYRRNWLLDHCLTARLIYNRYIGGLFKEVWEAPGPHRTAMDPVHYLNGAGFCSVPCFRSNLERIVAGARSSGAEPVLVTFAWRLPPELTSQNDRRGGPCFNTEDVYNYAPVRLWGTIEYVREGLTRHNRVVREVASMYGVPLLDLAVRLPDERELFGDVCHFSEEGTDRVVAEIASYFSAQGFFPLPATDASERDGRLVTTGLPEQPQEILPPVHPRSKASVRNQGS